MRKELFNTVGHRDIAITIDSTVNCADVMNVIKKAGGKYLESIKLFDVYQGAQVGEGKKSMAFNLIFVAEDKTLNVEEVDSIIKKVLKSLEYQLGAQLR